MQVPSYEELLELLIAGNDPSPGWSGTLVEIEDGAVRREVKVWRWRDLIRIEDPPGDARLLAGERMLWCGRTEYEEEVWEVRDPDSVPGRVGLSYLLDPREEWTRWLSGDRPRVMRTLHAISYEGRRAWEFSMPAVKGGSPTVIVDAELGLVLRMAREDLGHAEEWHDVRVEPDVTPSFFAPTHRDRAKLLPLPSGVSAPTDDELQLESAQARLRLMEGLARALADPRALVDVLMAGRTLEESRAALEKRFGLDEVQVTAVLDLQFRQVNELGRTRIFDERDQLLRQVADLRRGRRS
jgi:DNA gyrase subunit A